MYIQVKYKTTSYKPRVIFDADERRDFDSEMAEEARRDFINSLSPEYHNADYEY